MLITSLLKIKKRNVGLGYKNLNDVLKNFGGPISWSGGISCSASSSLTIRFNLIKAEQEIKSILLFNASLFNSGLRKFVIKRIRILKLNRTLRGVRHSQFLPVRHQRSKTNSKTQKRKRS